MAMKKWLAGFMVCFMWLNSAAAEGFPSSEPVFAATFEDMEGRPVALAAYRGKPLVLNFWATWCPPCRKEIPELVEFHRRHAARGVALIGLAVEDRARLPEFIDANAINYPVLAGRDKGVALLQALGNQSAGLPYTVVIDRQGNIVYTRRGTVTRERLEQVLEPLL
jgi:peroxiredoxin